MNNEMKEKLVQDYSIKICEAFNDILSDNDIYIPDECREGNEEEANLYSESYYQCEDSVKEMLSHLIDEIDRNKKQQTIVVDFSDSCDDNTIIVGSNLNFKENDTVFIFREPSVINENPILVLKVKIDNNIDENLVYISKNNYFNKMHLDFGGDVIHIIKI